MARLSYGGDMFSPVRCDHSTNEDSFLGGRNSDIFFSTWKDLSSGIDNDERKEGEKNIYEGTADTKEEKPINGKETKTVKHNLSSLMKSSENLIDTSSLKNSSQEDLSKKKMSRVTTRKSSLLNTKKRNELHEEADPVKKTNDMQKLSKHVTMRSSTRKKSTHLTGDLKKSNKFSNASFPTLNEEIVEKAIDSAESCIDTLSEDSIMLPGKKTDSGLVGQDFTQTALVNFTKELKEKQISPICKTVLPFSNIQKKNEVTPSTVNCESQTDLLMSELSLITNKTSAEKHNFHTCVNQGSNLFSSQFSNQSQQIQAGIIEKLVKDTVSFEFDSIRQMLYLQQLSLFRHLDRNAEAMKQNSSDCNVLLKIIDELMEENRQLRKIIANQNINY